MPMQILSNFFIMCLNEENKCTIRKYWVAVQNKVWKIKGYY